MNEKSETNNSDTREQDEGCYDIYTAVAEQGLPLLFYGRVYAVSSIFSMNRNITKCDEKFLVDALVIQYFNNVDV